MSVFKSRSVQSVASTYYCTSPSLSSVRLYLLLCKSQEMFLWDDQISVSSAAYLSQPNKCLALSSASSGWHSVFRLSKELCVQRTAGQEGHRDQG